MLNTKLTLVFGTLFLFSCGGSTSSNSVVFPETPVVLPEIQPPTLSVAKLKPASAKELHTQLTNGLYYGSTSSRTTALPEVAPNVSDSEATVTPSFSQTITQESGVDEADSIKYNGEWLFITTPEQNTVRALRREADGTLSSSQYVALGLEEGTYINGLYLSVNHLSVLSRKTSFSEQGLAQFWSPDAEKFSLSIVDLNSAHGSQTLPSNDEIQTIQFDGNLITSRRVGNQLILLSTYWPSNVTLPVATTDTQRQANLATLSAIPVSQFLPTYEMNNVREALVDEASCFIPEDATELNGYGGVVTLTIIDIAEPTRINSICVNGMYDGIYAAQNNLVIFGQNYVVDAQGDYSEQTVLHHFAVANGAIAYNGSANLAGRLDWNQPHLRLSIFEQQLRVVTTESTQDITDRFDHQFYSLSLSAQDRTLPVLGRLPNSTFPQAIGKPNEDITAVRFFGDRAYVVTFERIDPLYILDLSEPAQPFIAGELEIPGYSSYLLPLSAKYLLGIGQNIDPNRFIMQGDLATSMPAPIAEGAKVALFDVSTDTPRLVNEVVYEQGATPAEFDYKAITYLPLSSADIRIGLPVQSWSNDNDIGRSESRLELLQITLENGGDIDRHGQIQSPENTQWSVWRDRAVFDGDDIYYIHHGAVYHAMWSAPSVLVGRY
mgnify:CR=1 FL=1